MQFNFDLDNTSVFRSLKIWSFPLFRYAKIASQVFLAFCVFSLLLVLLSLFGLILPIVAIKIFIFFFFFYLLFFEIDLLVGLKVKNSVVTLPQKEALAALQEYNLAEFLSLPLCNIVEQALKKSKRKKLPGLSCELVFYFLLKKSRSTQELLLRLGFDVKKLEQELNNHLEKQYRDENLNVSIPESFKAAVYKAADATVKMGNNVIGERELLVGLAAHDDFFKKTLQDHDIKQADVENLALWLCAREQSIKKNEQFWSKENLAGLGSLGKDFASGFTITLDKFSIDWRSIAKKSTFYQIIGHTKEVEELEMILVKSQFGNALIVGEQGVGRKSIVQALAKRCYLCTGLPELHTKRVVELNMTALCSQIQDQEKLEAAVNQIFSEALAAGNVILVIDQIEDFVGQKNTKLGTVDISAILSKYLAMPRFHFIGITSFEALHQTLEQNPALLQYFGKVEVSEITPEQTAMILQNITPSTEKKYRLIITYPAIREIINLTARYFPSTPFPKKAIDVLEEVAIYVNSLGGASFGHADGNIVLPAHVAKIVSDKAKVPLGKMEFTEKSVLLNLENLIHQKIIGQDQAVREISIALRRARSGLASKKRPMGVFLFLGPTGVGKTETAKALSQIYFSGEDKMIRLDMSEFSLAADVGRLLGQVSPVAEPGLLTTPVREKPFSLVLLDEIEKAHPNILNLFLQVFDEGHITDGQGRKVIFTNTIIICTSNAGAELIFEQAEGDKKIEKDKLFDFLFEKRIFKPEFINRFDAVVMFNSLDKENLLQIAGLHLQDLAKNLKEENIDFIISEALKEKVVELSYKPEFGARQMRRVVQDNIENVIAQALIADSISLGDRVEINPQNFEIIKNNKG